MVGGGLLGLWTALEVREQAPDASVVLIEGEACGFGASGRNGGWMTSWWDELDALEARFGADDARWLAARSSEAIDRVAAGHRGGGDRLRAAPRRRADRGDRAGPAHAPARPRPKGPVRRVDADELRRRTGAAVGLAGVELSDAAAVHPARLVRGLRAPRPAPRRAHLRGHADAFARARPPAAR